MRGGGVPRRQERVFQGAAAEGGGAGEGTGGADGVGAAGVDDGVGGTVPASDGDVDGAATVDRQRPGAVRPLGAEVQRPAIDRRVALVGVGVGEGDGPAGLGDVQAAVPLMALLMVLPVALDLKARAALSVTAPVPRLRFLAPSPICRVPALTVVVPCSCLRRRGSAYWR